MSTRTDRLVVTNEWQYLSYTFRGRPLIPSMYATARVRFRDGHEHDHPIVWAYQAAQYSDHGKTVTVVQQIPKIRVDYHGETAALPLADLDIIEVFDDR